MRIRSIFKIQDLQIQASTLELMNCLGNKFSCHTSVFKCWLRNKFTVFLLFLLKDCDLGHFEKLPLPPRLKMLTLFLAFVVPYMIFPRVLGNDRNKFSVY